MSISIADELRTEILDGLGVQVICPDDLRGLRLDCREVAAHKIGFAKKVENERGADYDQRQQEQKYLALQC